MEIPLDSLIHVDEDPIVRLPQDHAGNVFTGRILLFHRLPRVVLHPLEAEGDPVLLTVNGEHVHGDTLTRREHVGRMVDVIPRQLGDMRETVGAA